jgi:hypothetical protein
MPRSAAKYMASPNQFVPPPLLVIMYFFSQIERALAASVE